MGLLYGGGRKLQISWGGSAEFVNVIARLGEAEPMRQTPTVCGALTGLFSLHHLFCSGLHHASSPSDAATQQQLMKRGGALASKIARPPCLSGFLASIYPHQRGSYIWRLQILSGLFHSIMPPVPVEWHWEFPLEPMKSYVVNQQSESLSDSNI